MSVHPFFLLRSAEANEDQIRVGVLDHSLDLFVFRGGQNTKRGRVDAGDLEAGELPAETRLQLVQSFRSAAIEKDALPFLYGVTAEFQHQGWSVDARLASRPERAQGPDDGHAVRGSDVGCIEGEGYLGVVLSQDYAMHRCDADVMRGGGRRNFALPGPMGTEIHYLCVGGFADANADDMVLTRNRAWH